jgi:tricorn protease
MTETEQDAPYEKVAGMLGLNRDLGDRVPGTGTAVYTAGQIELRLVFGVAQVAFRTKEGTFFENTETIPDQLIRADPTFISQGRDPQLEATVAVLLAVIDAE